MVSIILHASIPKNVNHTSVVGIPGVSITLVVGELKSANVAMPLTTPQSPSPIIGVFAAKVVELTLVHNC